MSASLFPNSWFGTTFRLHSSCATAMKTNFNWAFHPSFKEYSLVKISVQEGHLLVSRLQEGLSSGQQLRCCRSLFLAFCGVGAIPFMGGIRRVEALHEGQNFVTSHLDFDDTLRFKNTCTGIDIGIHLHLLSINRWIQHDPCTTAKFTIGNDVHEDGLLVAGKTINDF